MQILKEIFNLKEQKGCMGKSILECFQKTPCFAVLYTFSIVYACWWTSTCARNSNNNTIVWLKLKMWCCLIIYILHPCACLHSCQSHCMLYAIGTSICLTRVFSFTTLSRNRFSKRNIYDLSVTKCLLLKLNYESTIWNDLQFHTLNSFCCVTCPKFLR